MANIQSRRGGTPRGFDFFRDFERQMSDLFEDFTRGEPSIGAGQREFAPLCDVHETDTHYVLSFDVPGVKKDDINIEVQDNVLSISGERQQEIQEKGGQRMVERTYGRFMRSFTLPRNIEEEKVEAHFENGVLTLGIPKAEGAQRRNIEIKEGTGGLFGKLVGGSSKKSATKH